MNDLAELESRGLAELAACADEAALRAWNTAWFGKAGHVPAALKGVGTYQGDKRAYGQQANQLKDKLTKAHDAALAAAQDRALAHSLATEKLDITLPGRPVPRGRLHPSTRTLRHITAIFA